MRRYYADGLGATLDPFGGSSSTLLAMNQNAATSGNQQKVRYFTTGRT